MEEYIWGTVKMTTEYNQNSSGEGMTSKVYLDEDLIVHVESIGIQTEREALKVREKVLELGKKVPGKIRILNDLSRVTKATSGSRKVTVESIKLEDVGKVASFGANTFTRVLASFIIRACGMAQKVRQFETEEEGLRWLKEDE